MTDNTQPLALMLADRLHHEQPTVLRIDAEHAGEELRRQHARIAELEALLEAIRAGGVSGPLMGQPQAMPDLSALTERGAKAWAGVDAQGLREGRWYMVTHDGMATLCEDRRDAEKEAKDADMAWPHSGPHRAVQLVEASTAGFTAADMATAAAQGFRDGVASTASPTAQAEGWRDIATATKDSKARLVWCPERKNIYAVTWLVKKGWIVFGGRLLQEDEQPTHWMPLPLPPTSAEGVEHG